MDEGDAIVIMFFEGVSLEGGEVVLCGRRRGMG